MEDKSLEKSIDIDALKELEASKNDVLKRVAERLRNQMSGNTCAGHSSHSSGNSSRTHSSTTTH